MAHELFAKGLPTKLLEKNLSRDLTKEVDFHGFTTWKFKKIAKKLMPILNNCLAKGFI